MAKKSMILKQQRAPKFSSRQYNRCKLCGRPHAYPRRAQGKLVTPNSAQGGLRPPYRGLDISPPADNRSQPA